MWDIGDEDNIEGVGCWGCDMVGMWDVRYV